MNAPALVQACLEADFNAATQTCAAPFWTYAPTSIPVLTIADAQQILVLDHGSIIECGTHTALLAANGAYAQMWQRQQVRQDASLDSPLDGASDPEQMAII